MQRDHRVYLKDILEAIRKIKKYTRNLTFEELTKDELVLDGVVRNLEIIGEAVKQIPAEIKNKNPDIEWKKIAGLRDILTHAYFGIDEAIVWDVIKNKIPELKNKISKIISEIDGK
jgi:uncharacterized protein with HEPN domain